MRKKKKKKFNACAYILGQFRILQLHSCGSETKGFKAKEMNYSSLNINAISFVLYP